MGVMLVCLGGGIKTLFIDRPTMRTIHSHVLIILIVTKLKDRTAHKYVYTHVHMHAPMYIIDFTGLG